MYVPKFVGVIIFSKNVQIKSRLVFMIDKIYIKIYVLSM